MQLPTHWNSKLEVPQKCQGYWNWETDSPETAVKINQQQQSKEQRCHPANTNTMPKQKFPMPKIITTPRQDIVETIQSLSHA